MQYHLSPSSYAHTPSAARETISAKAGTCWRLLLVSFVRPLNILPTQTPIIQNFELNCSICHTTIFKTLTKDTVSERLRRWTRNPLGSARRGSNPLGVAHLCKGAHWSTICHHHHMHTHHLGAGHTFVQDLALADGCCSCGVSAR